MDVTRARRACVWAKAARDGPSPGAESANAKESATAKELRKKLTKEDLASQGPAQEKHWLLSSTWFNAAIFLAVGASCLQLGVEVDMPEMKGLWDFCESCFTGLFLVEALIKISILRGAYFRCKWNVLDFSLLSLAIVDVWIISAVSAVTVDLQTLTILRVLRLLRLVRVLKLAKRWRKCVLIVSGVLQAMHTAAWVGIVLAGLLYICGIAAVTYFRGSIGEAYPGYTTDRAVIDSTDMVMDFNPHVFFGNLSSAMLTLYNIAIMVEWSEVVRPVFMRDPFICILFVFFSLFVTFGVINVIVGMIVETVMNNAKELEELESQRDVQAKLAIVRDLEVLWNEVIDTDGGVSLELLIESMDKWGRQKSLMDLVALPRGYGATELFHMLDDDGSRQLSHDEFVGNFYRLIDSGAFQQTCIVQKGINDLKFAVRNIQNAVESNEERLLRIEALLTRRATAGAASDADVRSSTESNAENPCPLPCGPCTCGTCYACQLRESIRLDLSQASRIPDPPRTADALERLSQILRSVHADSTAPGRAAADSAAAACVPTARRPGGRLPATPQGARKADRPFHAAGELRAASTAAVSKPSCEGEFPPHPAGALGLVPDASFEVDPRSTVEVSPTNIENEVQNNPPLEPRATFFVTTLSADARGHGMLDL